MALVVPAVIYSQDGSSTENKNVTIIQGTSAADGKSEVGERILEECIVSLPRVDVLAPVVTSESAFRKEINGDPAKNDFLQTYTATVDVNYMLYQKVLVVVTTNSVNGQEPVMKVMEKNLKQTKRIVSDPSGGDVFAGRSHRQYYFSTSDGAEKDVKKRAGAWIKQQASVVCNK
jgi:hypothetical protein